MKRRTEKGLRLFPISTSRTGVMGDDCLFELEFEEDVGDCTIVALALCDKKLVEYLQGEMTTHLRAMTAPARPHQDSLREALAGGTEEFV